MVTKDVWQEFIDTGKLETGGGIRTVVIDSWCRCRNQGINARKVPGIMHISKHELYERQTKKQEILSVACSLYNSLQMTISQSGCLLGVVDEDGFFLEVYGDKTTLEIARKFDIVAGANWNEDFKGTNAAGTSLYLRTPVYLSGAEHYARAYHGWYTCAAPVLRPDGTIAGVLTVANYNNDFHHHTLGMVIALANSVENHISQGGGYLARDEINNCFIENSPHAIIVVDNLGIVTFFNKQAEEFMGVSGKLALGENAANIFSDEDTGSGSIVKLLGYTQETGRPLRDFQRTFKMPRGNRKSCVVNCYPLKNSVNDPIGVMTVIKGFNSRSGPSKKEHPEVLGIGSHSVMDPLTGLYNNKYFHERLTEEVRRGYMMNSKTSVLMLDIDCFRHYNEVLGYPAGDRLLGEFSGILKRTVRGKDVISRYEGGEFAVILTDTDAQLAMDIAERIRDSIERHPFDGRDIQPKGKITVSVGAATFPDNASGKEELLKVAQEALLRAKHSSKSKVSLYFSVFDDLKMELNQSDYNLLSTIKTLITVINAKDKYTFGHSERVLGYSIVLAKHLGFNDEQLKYLKYGSYLHDIGKIEIGRELLSKKGSLTPEEWAVLKLHPQWGADIIKPVNVLRQILPQVLYHHERFNGTGYPEGLTGTEIPLNARILAITDSYDAMTNDRPYRNALSKTEAIRELRRCSGTQFDPDLVNSFIKALEKEGFRNKVS